MKTIAEEIRATLVQNANLQIWCVFKVTQQYKISAYFIHLSNQYNSKLSEYIHIYIYRYMIIAYFVKYSLVKQGIYEIDRQLIFMYICDKIIRLALIVDGETSLSRFC